MVSMWIACLLWRPMDILEIEINALRDRNDSIDVIHLYKKSGREFIIRTFVWGVNKLYWIKDMKDIEKTFISIWFLGTAI